MLIPLVCLIGLTLAGQDGSPVPTPPAVVRAADPWDEEALPTFAFDETEHERDEANTSSTPLDDEFEEFPDEPEGDDEEDPGEAMGAKGRSTAAASILPLGLVGLIESPPPLLSRAAVAAPPKGSPLSLLCRLRI